VRTMALSLFLACCLPLVIVSVVAAQFDLPDEKKSAGREATHRLQIGCKVLARGGPCAGLVVSCPVPMDWPEQQVKIIDEKTTPNVKRISYRTLGGTAKQLLISIPRLASGEKAQALVTFEITRQYVIEPTDTASLAIPKKVDRAMRKYLAPSPFIESLHTQIRRLSRETIKGREGDWAKVEALYDITREKVEYKNGELKGAIRALRDGTGDCEEMTSLFVALCRAGKIPARMVWVDGHCYPEFYLTDKQKKGRWYPCQAAGTRAFGSMPEHRAILQKGDNFRDPDRPKERLRYVNDFAKGKAIRGGGKPRIKFIRQPADG